MKIRLIEVTGGIHATASVEEQPDISLRAWRVFAVEGLSRKVAGVTHHFVGHNVLDGEGRASTAIEKFDLATRRGRTESGRVYELLGKPGRDRDAEYVWNRWKAINCVTSETDVTKQYWLAVPLRDN